MGRGTLGIAAALMAIQATASLLGNEGFEDFTGATPTGVPGSAQTWAFDGGTVVGVDQGLSPAQGLNMLRFERTTSSGAGSTTAGDVGQLISLGGQSSLVATGNAVAHFSAWFNRIPGAAATDTRFSLLLRAYSGPMSGYASQAGSPLSQATAQVDSDAQASTWEQLQVSLALPAATTYLAVFASAVENVQNDSQWPEFEGHYVDAAQLEVVPEPATLAALGLGCAWLWRRSKR